MHTSRRSVSEAFGLLAGSTASSRTGLRTRHASTWTHSSRSFTTTSPTRDLKEDAKNKLVEEGKKFAKDKVNERLGADETKQQAKNLSSSTSKILFAGLAVAGAAYLLMGGNVHAEEARRPTDSASGPKYSKDQVTLLCLVGPSLSGKTTQAKRLVKRFDKELDDIVSPKSLDELESILATRAKGEKRTSLVVDNFPTTLEDAQRIERELVPIFCFSFYDLPLKDFEKRLAKDDKEKKQKVEQFKKYTKSLEPLVKKYRDQGNIYEISADWESADEVWEQVEAKTEQILELREMGEL
ncbi:P-loop containing nucleoside triphosphate hydrolase [Kalmanozyma brasiliensis GHG001]|uniref:P-loop containing nucleoside triphosphate hydrolase protein n=1 Tax=Kalmanozyma brasiliensis (strain GHG001) TaxID=1365824 RepID=V5F1B0_KALBG|nr:P-loop containing nucleoside triphosphate hydrolase [Kalmanozyma brasiliensis GHG001]EST10108.1 P-loop containing nucleoside triphosphate hydrolase [Kalmanozyma brasiliensis GHG001]